MSRLQVALVVRAAESARLDVVEHSWIARIGEGLTAQVAVGTLGDQPLAELPVLAVPRDRSLRMQATAGADAWPTADETKSSHCRRLGGMSVGMRPGYSTIPVDK
jgi:hypothetical protein